MVFLQGRDRPTPHVGRQADLHWSAVQQLHGLLGPAGRLGVEVSGVAHSVRPEDGQTLLHLLLVGDLAQMDGQLGAVHVSGCRQDGKEVGQVTLISTTS